MSDVILAAGLVFSMLATGVRGYITLYWVTLNNASDYRTNGLYWTPNPNPNPNPSPLVHQPDSPLVH